MTKFYDNELERQDAMHHHLRKIFRARKDPQAVALDSSIYSSRIGASHIISDGHVDGRHEAMVCARMNWEISVSLANPRLSLSRALLAHSEGKWKGSTDLCSLGGGFQHWE